MPFTNFAAQQVIYNLGSSLPNNFISSVEIGTGSGTALVTNVTLVAGSLRNVITGSPDFSSPRIVGFQADFNSVQMSGIQLTEFGLFTSGAKLIGSTWAREAFNPVEFDGTNELQISYAIQAIPG